MTLRRFSLALAVGVLAPLTACSGLKEAMTAHVDVVAKVGSNELSVERLGTVLGQSQAPISKETARTVADLWVDYQLVAMAAAAGDSLTSPQVQDEALATVFSRMVVDKWYRGLQPTFQANADTSSYRKQFDDGAVFGASHILLTVAPNASPAQKAEVKKKIEGIRARVSGANFAATAQKESQDPGSSSRGGQLGVFPAGTMVPPFENALKSLKPGEISGVVETQFGFHIIRRSSYDEVKGDVAKQFGQRSMQQAESTYVAKLEKDAGVELKPNAVATLRAVAGNLEGYVKDNTTIASMKGGDFTAAQLADLLLSVPSRGQLLQQVAQSPDSIVREQLLKPIVRTEVVVRAAKASGTKLDTTETNPLRASFVASLRGAWNGLGVSPQVLNDSVKAAADRGKFAAARVETALERIIAGQMQPVQVPPPVERALKAKYSASVNPAGVDRAVERAKQVRAQSDSARSKAVPPSAVPIPGVPPGADKALPTDAAPATKK